jgi:hypothetical protein
MTNSEDLMAVVDFAVGIVLTTKVELLTYPEI